METNFFTTLDQHLNHSMIIITMEKVQDQLTVIFRPVPNIDDKSAKAIPPLKITGSAPELNQTFFQDIQKPLELVDNYAKSFTEWETALNKAKAMSRMEADKKNKRNKLEAEADKKLKEAEKHLEAKDFNQALKYCTAALKIIDGYQKAKDLTVKVKKESGLFHQPSIFPQS